MAEQEGDAVAVAVLHSGTQRRVATHVKIVDVGAACQQLGGCIGSTIDLCTGKMQRRAAIGSSRASRRASNDIHQQRQRLWRSTALRSKVKRRQLHWRMSTSASTQQQSDNVAVARLHRQLQRRSWPPRAGHVKRRRAALEAAQQNGHNTCVTVTNGEAQKLALVVVGVKAIQIFGHHFAQSSANSSGLKAIGMRVVQKTDGLLVVRPPRLTTQRPRRDWTPLPIGKPTPHLITRRNFAPPPAHGTAPSDAPARKQK
mmetsp:Transcript_26321/g.63998  ORF Transcript_26321/g.63998 Transcript_26321/m.63998 type:complete len:257 (-) Transcript_26321:384-1154(-)